MQSEIELIRLVCIHFRVAKNIVCIVLIALKFLGLKEVRSLYFNRITSQF